MQCDLWFKLFECQRHLISMIIKFLVKQSTQWKLWQLYALPFATIRIDRFLNYHIRLRIQYSWHHIVFIANSIIVYLAMQFTKHIYYHLNVDSLDALTPFGLNANANANTNETHKIHMNDAQKRCENDSDNDNNLEAIIIDNKFELNYITFYRANHLNQFHTIPTDKL